MAHQPARYTESIGLKVTPEQYRELSDLASLHSQPLAEWCREALLAVAGCGRPSPVEYGILAEVTATQAIVIDLLCALGKEGRLSVQKAQQIVDAADESKFTEALEVLQVAHAKASKLRLQVTARQWTPEKQEPEE